MKRYPELRDCQAAHPTSIRDRIGMESTAWARGLRLKIGPDRGKRLCQSAGMRKGNGESHKVLLSAVLFLAECMAHCDAAAENGDKSLRFDVREYGAKGDGVTLDTAAINKAIEACAQAGGGQVLFPAGRFLSGTVRLRSQVNLYLDAGARLIGTTNLDEYKAPEVPGFMPEAKWGKWH